MTTQVMQFQNPPTITTKLQIQYRTVIIKKKTTQNLAEQKSYDYRYKEKVTLKLVGEAQMRNELVPHVADKNQEGYLCYRGSP